MGGVSPNALDATVTKIRRYFNNHHVTTMIFDEPDEEVRQSFTDVGIECHFLRGSLKTSTVRLGSYLTKQFQHFDLIHIYGSPVNHGLAPAVVSTVAGIPLISRFNGYDLTSVADGKITTHVAKRAAQYFLQNSDIVVFNSQPQMSDLLDQYEIRKLNRHKVISPGVIKKWFSPASTDLVNRTRKSLNIKENTNIIGAVMTPRPVKRLDRMFDMIDMISESRDVILIIVGESEYNEKYRHEAQSRGINNRIRWVGHQHATNLSKFYSLFDITIMTSEFESFGQSISESYLCGTPCVAFDTGGMSEQINHQSTGYLVTQGDIKSFSDYVIDLLSDIEQRNKFAMAGKEYVRQRFVLRQVSKQYSKLISQLIDRI